MIITFLKQNSGQKSLKSDHNNLKPAFLSLLYYVLNNCSKSKTKEIKYE